MGNNKWKKIIFIAAFIVTFLVGGLGTYIILNYLPANQKNTNNNEKVIEEKVTITDKGIASAVKKIYDAVVVVETYKNNKLISSGTGFVYKKSGDIAYVLTNHHVINGGDRVNVTFTNGENVETKIIGSDSYADIAVLSVSSSKIISLVKIGNSEAADVGDTVFAVGAPLESAYSWTVTRGILSGKDRMVEVSINNSGTSDWVMKVMQTDTAINSGNSGGPLANVNGEVIGVTSLKLVSSGVEGMGFAIPIEDAIEYATKIENGEEIIRPYLGVSMVDASYAIYYGAIYPEGADNGVFVSLVEKNSPADVAGLKEGDIIVKIGDSKVTSVAVLRYNLYKYKSGDNITISYYREDLLKVANVKLVDSQ